MSIDSKPRLTLGGAEKLAAACIAQAGQEGVAIAVAVVDDGGHIILMHRMTGVPPGASDVVVGKARTAALLGMPTKMLDDLCTNRPAFLSVKAVILEGGLPIVHRDAIIGGIGVGGAAPEQDARIATSALAVLTV
jgi:glc operon protein GlcG